MKVIDTVKIILANNNDILMSYFDIEYKRDENNQPILDKVEVSSDADELQILIEHLTFMSIDKDHLDKLVKSTVKGLDNPPEKFEEFLQIVVKNTYVELLQTALNKYKKLNKEEIKNGSIN